MSAVIIPAYDGRVKRKYPLVPIRNLESSLCPYGYGFNIFVEHGYRWVTDLRWLPKEDWYAREALKKLTNTQDDYLYVVGSDQNNMDKYLIAESLGTYWDLPKFIEAMRL
jgi:hypothetical protein